MNQLLKAFAKQRVNIDDHDSFRIRYIAFRIFIRRPDAFHFNRTDDFAGVRALQARRYCSAHLKNAFRRYTGFI